MMNRQALGTFAKVLSDAEHTVRTAGLNGRQALRLVTERMAVSLARNNPNFDREQFVDSCFFYDDDGEGVPT